MVRAACGAAALALLAVIAVRVDAQDVSGARPQVGLEALFLLRPRFGADVAYPVVRRGPALLRVDVSGVFQIAAELPASCGPRCGTRDLRNPDAILSAGLSLELGTRGGLLRYWYFLASAGGSAVRWNEGALHPSPGIVMRDGHISGAPRTALGLGREFAAFRGRNRIEVRLETLHERQRAVHGMRIGVARRW